jgi:hypothetical protein
MASENAKRDQNYIPVLSGVTDDVSQEIRMVRIDPVTKRLLISAIVSNISSNLTVEEIDGTPSVSNVNKIRVTNGTLTDNGAGVVTLTIGGGGTPGGSSTQLQYNNAGSFGGVPTATFNGTNLLLNSTLRLTDNTDATKQVSLVLSGISTGTTRTWTFPNTDGTFARTSGSNTFTGTQTMTSPSITTSIVTSSTTFSAFNTTATTFNMAGDATTLTIGGTPTGSITHNYSINATASGNTKTLNLGTGGVTGSTTNVNIGSSNGGTTTISSPNVSLGGITGTTTTGTIELGNASDTTLSRASAGLIAVEGVIVPTVSSTHTLTNKTMTGATNTLTASLLKSATTEVDVSSSPAPTAGQVLTATSSTTATWQTPSGGGDEFAVTSNPTTYTSYPIPILSTGGNTASMRFAGWTTSSIAASSSGFGNWAEIVNDGWCAAWIRPFRGRIGSSENDQQFNTANKKIAISWTYKTAAVAANRFVGISVNISSAYNSNPNSSTNLRIGFTYDGTTLRSMTDNGSSVTTNSISATVSNWNRYAIIWTPGTDVKFYLNGTLVATHTTNIPSSASNMFFGFGGSAQTIYIGDIVVSLEI